MDDPLIEKPADADLHPLLKRRWSPRVFSPEPVERAKLRRIFEAARWSASFFNEQPWRYLLGVRGDGPSHEMILNCLGKGNQTWAKNAPVLVIACVQEISAATGKPGSWCRYDLGQASAHLTVQAMAEGVWVHQMAGFSADRVREAFKVPAEFSPVTAIAMGYRGGVGDLSEEVQKREQEPRTRRPLGETVFSGTWGGPGAIF